MLLSTYSRGASVPKSCTQCASHFAQDRVSLSQWTAAEETQYAQPFNFSRVAFPTLPHPSLPLQAVSEDEEEGSSSEEPTAAAAAAAAAGPASASALEQVALLPLVPAAPAAAAAGGTAGAADGHAAAGLEGPFLAAAAAASGADGMPDSVDSLLTANRDVVEAGRAAAAALAARPKVRR